MAYVGSAGPDLRSIRKDATREVPHRQGTGKGRGVDGWGPNELTTLPDAGLGALRAMMEELETQGSSRKLADGFSSR